MRRHTGTGTSTGVSSTSVAAAWRRPHIRAARRFRWPIARITLCRGLRHRPGCAMAWATVPCACGACDEMGRGCAVLCCVLQALRLPVLYYTVLCAVCAEIACAVLCAVCSPLVQQ